MSVATLPELAPPPSPMVRHLASTLCGIAVVWVTGHAACLALSHVEAIDA